MEKPSIRPRTRFLLLCSSSEAVGGLQRFPKCFVVVSIRLGSTACHSDTCRQFIWENVLGQQVAVLPLTVAHTGGPSWSCTLKVPQDLCTVVYMPGGASEFYPVNCRNCPEDNFRISFECWTSQRLTSYDFMTLFRAIGRIQIPSGCKLP